MEESNDISTQKRLRLLLKSSLPADILIQKICGKEKQTAAFSLVYDIYLAKNYIIPNEEKIRLRTFDILPETVTFVAKKIATNEIIGVLTVIRDSKQFGLPSDSVFKEQLDSLRLRANLPEYSTDKICELSNQVIKKEFRNSSIVFELMKAAKAHILENRMIYAIASVSAIHEPFYKLIGFERIGGETSFSKELNDPVVLLANYLIPAYSPETLHPAIYDALIRNNPYFTKTSFSPSAKEQ